MTNDQAPMTKRQWPHLDIGIWSLVILQFGFFVYFGANCRLLAAEVPPVKQKLLDRTPFDEIMLNAASGGTKFEVLPLNLPQTALGTLPQQGKLKLRLLDRPTEEFEVAWANVARVRVFEQMLMDEAQRLAAAGQF